MPHRAQNPSVRPGLSPRLRPTSAPHDGQSRFDSSTSATAITADRGSVIGVEGTVVSPAPSRGARVREAPAKRRVDVLLPLRAEPMGALASRYDAAVATVPPVRPVRLLGALASAFAALALCRDADCAIDGAPHTSQYPSCMEPEHPLCSHCMSVSLIAACGCAHRVLERGNLVTGCDEVAGRHP